MDERKITRADLEKAFTEAFKELGGYPGISVQLEEIVIERIFPTPKTKYREALERAREGRREDYEKEIYNSGVRDCANLSRVKPGDMMIMKDGFLFPHGDGWKTLLQPPD